MFTYGNGKHRCNGCRFLLTSPSSGGAFCCGRYSAPNGTAWSLDAEREDGIWSDPQACAECPGPGGEEEE